MVAKLEALLVRLGKETDVAIAADTGLNNAAVGQLRRWLGIAPLSAPRDLGRPTLAPEECEAAYLLAKKHGGYTAAVRAEGLDISGPVLRWRAVKWADDNGLPPPLPPAKRPDAERLEGVRHRLGKVPDQRIADEVGCSVMHVNRWRRKLGIPSHRSRRG